MSAGHWRQIEVRELLTLDAAGPDAWRSRFGDPNLNGRSYGGQLLGQAMAAALGGVPEGRRPTMMQFLFLQGAVPDEPIEFAVTPLQDGKRFSSRHVRGAQLGRYVLDAQVTCAVDLDAPAHGQPTTAPPGECPESLGTLDDVPLPLRKAIAAFGGYSDDRKPALDFRIPDASRQLDPVAAGPHLRFWMRVTQPLGDDERMHAAAFAYISDWWLNYASLSPHLKEAGRRKLYISSLNHAIWLHRPVRADAWLHVQSTSPCARVGRGLSIAQVHDLEGRLVASATQECLMAYAG